MLSSPNQSNRLVDTSIDKRTTGYKRRKEGVFADYVLMDTWFTTETMIKSVLDEGLHVIGMFKQLKQKYSYHGYSCDLKELRTLLPKRKSQ